MKEQDIVSNIYSGFFLRDLTYIFSGALFILSFTYWLDSQFMGLPNISLAHPWLFIIYAVPSYYSGLTLYSTITLFPCKPIRNLVFSEVHKRTKDMTDNRILQIMLEAKEVFGEWIILSEERKIHFSLVGSTIGISSFYCSYLLLMTYFKRGNADDLYLSLFAILTSVLLILIGKQRNEKRIKYYHGLATILKEYKCKNTH